MSHTVTVTTEFTVTLATTVVLNDEQYAALTAGDLGNFTSGTDYVEALRVCADPHNGHLATVAEAQVGESHGIEWVDIMATRINVRDDAGNIVAADQTL